MVNRGQYQLHRTTLRTKYEVDTFGVSRHRFLQLHTGK